MSNEDTPATTERDAAAATGTQPSPAAAAAATPAAAGASVTTAAATPATRAAAHGGRRSRPAAGARHRRRDVSVLQLRARVPPRLRHNALHRGAGQGDQDAHGQPLHRLPHRGGRWRRGRAHARAGGDRSRNCAPRTRNLSPWRSAATTATRSSSRRTASGCRPPATWFPATTLPCWRTFPSSAASTSCASSWTSPIRRRAASTAARTAPEKLPVDEFSYPLYAKPSDTNAVPKRRGGPQAQGLRDRLPRGARRGVGRHPRIFLRRRAGHSGLHPRRRREPAHPEHLLGRNGRHPRRVGRHRVPAGPQPRGARQPPVHRRGARRTGDSLRQRLLAHLRFSGSRTSTSSTTSAPGSACSSRSTYARGAAPTT